MELYNGPLDTKEIFGRWLDEESESNYGAYIPFVGTIRAEDSIEALSFDIYEPILQKWFDDKKIPELIFWDNAKYFQENSLNLWLHQKKVKTM